MKSRLSMYWLVVSFLAIAGCGSDNREVGDGGTESFRASAACIGCHGNNKISPVTGVQIADEWRASAHNTKNGASCADCHKPMGHPNGGTITNNPNDTVCAECHTVTSLGTPHFSTFTTARQPQFVSAQDAQQCRVCHNPHDTSSVIQVNRDFTDSGHGDINSPAFTDNVNWPTRNPCVRCHTSTGYVTYVNSGGVTISTFTGRNEILGCKTCHTDYSWERRPVGAVTNPRYANVTSIHYPDARESNICLTCHVGREAGASIRQSPGFLNFTGTTNFINSHYLTAGGIIYAASGYEYAGRSYNNPPFYQHDQVGMTTGDGPCVGCHMKTTTSHEFLPVQKDANGVVTSVLSTACAECHGAGNPTPAELESEKAGLAAATEALKARLAVLNIHFFDSNPYFFTQPNGAGTRVTKWAKFSPANFDTGRNTMGAAFNLNMVLHDPGAYAHNRFYIKRLIYDSLDWSNNGILDNDVEAAINASSLTAAQKTAAINYLLSAPGGSRP
ncbi:hypothetical protein SAMN06269301_1805 [Geobacter sp. DSM 9736]|nr:hypothetical protein SAMN06269301_1805 [Geobacter sp. DSM 9736]